MKTSPLFTINLRDIAKGLIVAVAGAVITVIQSSVNAGNLKFNWHAIGVTALSAGIGYLVKNFLTAEKLIKQVPPSTQSL